MNDGFLSTCQCQGCGERVIRTVEKATSSSTWRRQARKARQWATRAECTAWSTCSRLGRLRALLHGGSLCL